MAELSHVESDRGLTPFFWPSGIFVVIRNNTKSAGMLKCSVSVYNIRNVKFYNNDVSYTKPEISKAPLLDVQYCKFNIQ